MTNDADNDLFSKRLTDWLFTGCRNYLKFQDNNKCTKYRAAGADYPGFDGWYNNIARPELGAADTPLLRRVPAVYEDGVFKPAGSARPQPLELSDKLLQGPIGSKSRTGRNALLVFFGGRIRDDLASTQPAGYIYFTQISV